MFIRFPLLSRIILFLAVPITIIIFLLLFVAKQSNAITAGQLTSDFVASNVKIQYDDLGVPNIEANAEEDVYFSMGFVHAQNRLWQMEMERRRASGRLSEVLGEKSLGLDIFMRTIGLDRNAKKLANEIPEALRGPLQAYANGVNDGISSLKRLPVEFSYFNFEPEPWTIKDSLLKHQLLMFVMGLNFNEEIQNYLILNGFDSDVANELLPSDLDFTEGDLEHVKQSIKPQAAKELLSKFTRYSHQESKFVGSNAWVISGQHTVSGKPILANDPHLPNAIPSAFYMMEVKSDSINVKGATFPGLPIFALGTNSQFAWGITSMQADTQDIYQERVHPQFKNRYLVDGQYHDIEVYEESIQVKHDPLRTEKKPYQLTVRRTHRGPIITDLVSDGEQVYSLRWTIDDEDGGSLISFLNLAKLPNAENITDVLKSYTAPILNIVYADNDNNIGAIAAGKYPLRSKTNGTLPTPGWINENDWSGWVPISHWPQTKNPVSGYVVAANQDVTPANYPYYISTSWLGNYRSSRISDLLETKIVNKSEGVTLEDNVLIQVDNYFVMVDTIHKYLSRKGGELNEYHHILQNWNGKKDDTAAALTISWFANLSVLLLEDDIKNSKLGSSSFSSLNSGIRYDSISKALELGNTKECEYHTDVKSMTCEEVIELALEKAVYELSKRLGTNVNNWEIEDLLQSQFIHFPFSGPAFTGLNEQQENKILKALFHRSLPGRGSGISVDAKGISLVDNTRYFQISGPSTRFITDLDSQTRFVLPTGQSSNILSQYYDDMLNLFERGRYTSFESYEFNESLIISSIKK